MRRHARLTLTTEELLLPRAAAARGRQSLGCIFGELLARQPLFPGNDYIDQLRLICAKLGGGGATVCHPPIHRGLLLLLLLHMSTVRGEEEEADGERAVALVVVV